VWTRGFGQTHRLATWSKKSPHPDSATPAPHGCCVCAPLVPTTEFTTTPVSHTSPTGRPPPKARTYKMGPHSSRPTPTRHLFVLVSHLPPVPYFGRRRRPWAVHLSFTMRRSRSTALPWSFSKSQRRPPLSTSANPPLSVRESPAPSHPVSLGVVEP
jgi:hypothetical protein